VLSGVTSAEEKMLSPENITTPISMLSEEETLSMSKRVDTLALTTSRKGKTRRNLHNPE
jgi:hypothetical protein